MERRGAGRFCRACEHTVIDLVGLSRAQADARLSRVRGVPCVRAEVDARGEAVYAPGPSRTRRAAGGLVLVSALTAGGCATSDPESPVITAIEEASDPDAPCALPMMPVESGASEADGALTGPVDAAIPVEGSGVPTPEQEALTARKHRPIRMGRALLHP